MSKKKYKYKNIVSLLSVGALYISNANAITFGDNQENEIQASFGFYKEQDRINVFKSVLDYKRNLDTDESFSIRLSIDSLTGSTPNGAVSSVNPQTFTSPSGGSPNYVDPNQQPQDKFEDTRYSVGINYENQATSIFKYVLGGNFSSETDYTSISGNIGLIADLNNKNTTISILGSHAYDIISAEGGIPTPYSYMNNPKPCDNNSVLAKDHDECFNVVAGIPYVENKSSSNQYKNTEDVILGITQILNKWSLMQFNYFVSISNGYHNDPYKVISVVDSNGNPVVLDDKTNLSAVIYENRPNHRFKQGLYAEYKATIFNDNIPSISYRFSFDDWSVNSNMVEIKYYLPITKKYFIQPYVRFYKQTQAYFYTPYLSESQASYVIQNNQYVSSDDRLSAMNTYSVALEFGRYNDIPWSIMLEYYHQKYVEPEKYGNMNNITLNPDVNAFLLLFNFKI